MNFKFDLSKLTEKLKGKGGNLSNLKGGFNLGALSALAKKNAKQKNANLAYYNADTKLFFHTAGGKVVQYTKAANSNLRIATLIPFDSLLKTNVEVPKTTDEREIDDFIIETAYQQLNIPTDANYEVSYFKIETSFDADNWNYDVYAIDTGELEKTFNDLVAKSQYIDVVTSTAFLPIVLYRKAKVDAIDNHIFVFIGANSGTFAFYSKGEPVYIKTLNCNMHRLRVEFNQETSLELNASEFEDYISNRAAEASTHKASIDSMLDKISRDIEENILYIKRVYQDLDPTALYFGMSAEYDNNFLTYFKDTFLIDTRPFNQLAFVNTTRGASAIANIAIHYADYYISNPNSKIPNFSYVKRPKALHQRESWQFLLIASICFVLSLVYPAYNLAMSGFYNFRAGMMQTDYDTVTFPKAEEYRARETQMKTEIENLQKTHAALNQEITHLRGNMSDIHTWQVGYIQKSKIVDDILKVAKNSKVSIVKYTAIANNNQQLIVELNLFARTQEDISDFIRNLNSQKTYKSVTTEKVEKFGVDITTTTPQGEAQRAGSAVANVAQSVAGAARSATNATTANAQNDGKEVGAMSAEFNFGANPELQNRVGGYLNSIVKVVVR